MSLHVNAQRVWEELETLATFSDAEPPAVTRVVFTPSDMRARAWIKELCSDADLNIREDAIGNLFAHWPGSQPELPAIGTGSHIDAIPSSGRFDGTVGVLGGLEAIRALKAAGFAPRRSIELLLFTSEEPTRFGIGCLGSRLLSGTLTTDSAGRLQDGDGQSFDGVRTAAGFTGPLTEVALARDYYSGFLELHIEQGPVLERNGKCIGAVESIAAPGSLRISIEGEGGHAGAVLMADRKDALLGAAELALAAEAAALATQAIDTVATTGVCQVFPDAVNSIPSRVVLEMDVRDTNVERRDAVLERITQAAYEIANRRRLEITAEILNADAPARCDPAMVETIERACGSTGVDCRRMVSRAYHDSLFMSRIAPVAMIFIPCRGGVSHRPDEYASPEHIASGIAVLARALRELAMR